MDGDRAAHDPRNSANFGVLTDALGLGLDELDRSQVDEITAVHPRGGFKNEFLQALGFRRITTVERIIGAPWPS
ncbi:hypothetical protein ACWEWG_33585 [Streptomyces sp. NPDC003758]